MIGVLGRPLRILAGNGLGQIMALAAVPLIARLYDVAAVGTFGLFATVMMLAATVAALCLDQAIALAQDDADLAGLQWASLGIAAGLALAAEAVLLALGTTPLAGRLPLHRAMLLLPPGVLLAVVLQVLLQTATLRRDHRRIARLLALRTGGTALAQIALWLLLPNAFGLIGGQLLALLAAVLLTAGMARPPPRAVLRRSLAAHRNCPRYLAPRLALGTAADIAVYLLIGAAFDAREVGIFWMAQRLLQVPSGFIDVPARQIFLSLALDGRDAGQPITRLLAALLGLLLAVGALVALAVFTLGPYVIPAVLGTAWAPVVPVAMVLVFGWMFEFAGIPFSGAVLLLDQQRAFFGYEIVSRGLRLAAVAAGCWRGDLLFGLALMSAASVVATAGFAMLLLWRSQPHAAPVLPPLPGRA